LIGEFTAEENAILGDQRQPRFARGRLAAPDEITEAARQRIEVYDVRPAEPRTLDHDVGGRQSAEARLRP
jgi:ABC-type uncharacterized transport system ATPase subunit